MFSYKDMDKLTDQHKLILGAVFAVIIAYVLHKQYKKKKSQGEEGVSEEAENFDNIPHNIENIENIENFEGAIKTYGDYMAPDREYNNVQLAKEQITKYFPPKDYAPPEQDWGRKHRNSANRGYKKSVYNAGMRGNLGASDWDKYFDYNNSVFENAQNGTNDMFKPVDETNGSLAIFKTGRNKKATCGSNQDCSPEDLFDVDKYLPQEVNDDWFDVQPEPISVKNRHLINITRPIGINTIATSLRNSSHDIRGTPPVPKHVVSPWLQSSIEPDTNLKPLM